MPWFINFFSFGKGKLIEFVMKCNAKKKKNLQNLDEYPGKSNKYQDCIKSSLYIRSLNNEKILDLPLMQMILCDQATYL